jgi:hypothetical protein
MIDQDDPAFDIPSLRLLPDQPFPPYAYVPGETPHPTRHRGGHSYGAEFETPEPPDPEDWPACPDYLYGIDLFNHGFYWEAHEAWEGLWVASGRRGAPATYLQALITLAAAGLKARSGSARGMAGECKEGCSPVQVRCESRWVPRDALHGARHLHARQLRSHYRRIVADHRHGCRRQKTRPPSICCCGRIRKGADPPWAFPS